MTSISFAGFLLTASVGIVTLLILVALPIHYGMKQARHERELKHAERMAALELGRPFPDSDYATGGSPARVAMVIGAVVPIGSLLIAWMATSSRIPELSYAIWPAAGSVGVAGVICGTILAARLTTSGRPGRSFETTATKPAFDPDAYDVVGSRG